MPALTRAQISKRFRESHKEQVAAYSKAWNSSHKAYFRQWYINHKEQVRKQSKENSQAIRLGVLQAYGGPVCKCCGETTVEFLAIDHIGGNGNKHLKSLGLKGGGSFMRWLRDQGYPPGFQVLCHNCNFAKHVYKECPHASVLRSDSQRNSVVQGVDSKGGREASREMARKAIYERVAQA